MDMAHMTDIDPEDLLLIIQLQQEDAQALARDVQPNSQETARLLMSDLKEWEDIITEHARLIEEAIPPQHETSAGTIRETGESSSGGRERADSAPSADPNIAALSRLTTGLVIRNYDGDDDDSPDSDSKTIKKEDAIPKTKDVKPARRRCISCQSKFQAAETVRFPCGHDYCHDCVFGLHLAATTDESLFPPRCCGREIPFNIARPIMSREDIETFEAKAIEFSTKDRTYCFKPTCSQFIPPKDIDRNVARCGSCRSKTSMGWQRCNACKSVVELSTGCNHMTCRCGSQFCYKCGMKWKTCRCSQWDENRLLARAETIVARDGMIAANTRAHQDAIDAVRQNIVENHNCNHGRWAKRNGRQRCEECRYMLPEYIFECLQCNLRACWRCRLNRL
ncbi:hypothetical protein CC79DRAFT_1383107 [Sarocladium strictum]